VARVTWLAASAVLTACSFAPGQFDAPRDAELLVADARPDGPPGESCLGAGLATVCYPADGVPTGEYRPQPGSLSTGVDANCDRIFTQTTGPELCIKHAATIVIEGDVAWTGSRPLVLIATQTITIAASAVLDVSRGAGGSGTGCMSPSTGEPDTATGASAGAGGGGAGGFSIDGGFGGNGQGSGDGGTAGGMIALESVRGGCPGAKGGNSSAGDGGTRGDPGGGVYLIAGDSIQIDGDILANGGGGQGGANKAGGGGAGSGGLIGLDAPTVTMGANGTLSANGGGGGEGGGGGSPGEDGDDALAYDDRADGGSDNSNGSNGGYGSIDTNAPTGGQMSGDGGGGGGGGAGYIRVFATTKALNAKISPPAT
jgi:hypothetical protein